MASTTFQNEQQPTTKLIRTLQCMHDNKELRRLLVESKFCFKSPVSQHIDSHHRFLFEYLPQIFTEGPAVQQDTENSGVRHKIYRISARIGPPVALSHKSE